MGAQRVLAHETWSEYFDAVGRELLDSRVSIGTQGRDAPRASERLSLIALHDDVLELSLTGSSADVRRVVLHPRRVAVDTQTLLAPMTISVEGRDGTRTLIAFEREPETWD